MFVYVLHVRLEFKMKGSSGCIHPASDDNFGEKKKLVFPVFLEEIDPGPMEAEMTHLHGKLPLAACLLTREKKLA